MADQISSSSPAPAPAAVTVVESGSQQASAAASPTPEPVPVPVPVPHVEIDSHFDSESDGDSTLGSGESSATTSIAASVFDFTYTNGRRYPSARFHKAGRDYYMPNDEIEQDRLDLFHHIFLMLLGGHLYTAPLDKLALHRVLDVATGTGIWAVDIADMHPEAEVVGNDLNPIQPNWVPPNVKFEVDDVEETWTYRADSFDYIHMRCLCGSIADWKRLLHDAYRTLAPGGYIEYQDYGSEGFLHDGTPLASYPPETMPPIGRWFGLTSSAAAKFGRPLVVARHMAQYLRDAGFVDIKVEKKVWPLSPWPKDPQLKEIGRWALMGCVDTVYPYASMLLTQDGWKDEDVRKLCDETVWELTKGKKKYYGEAWFVVGRKPHKDEC